MNSRQRRRLRRFNWMSFYPTDPALLTLQQTTANPGIATDLDAIVVENDNWLHASRKRSAPDWA